MYSRKSWFVVLGIFLLVIIFAVFLYYIPSQKIAQSKSPIQIVTTNDQVLDEKKDIFCPAVDARFDIINSSVGFNIENLIPVETNVSKNLILNTKGIFAVKKFNSGGDIYQYEKENKEKMNGVGPAGGVGVSEIIEPKDDNLGIFPITTITGKINDLLWKTDEYTTGVGYNESYFLLSLGFQSSGLFEIKPELAMKDIQEIDIPKEYSPNETAFCDSFVCESRNTNSSTLYQILGLQDRTIIFSFEQNTSTYAGYNLEDKTWKRIPVFHMESGASKIEKIIDQYGCFSYKTSVGDLIFTPHLLISKSAPHDWVNRTLDIFYNNIGKAAGSLLNLKK